MAKFTSAVSVFVYFLVLVGHCVCGPECCNQKDISSPKASCCGGETSESKSDTRQSCDTSGDRGCCGLCLFEDEQTDAEFSVEITFAPLEGDVTYETPLYAYKEAGSPGLLKMASGNNCNSTRLYIVNKAFLA